MFNLKSEASVPTSCPEIVLTLIKYMLRSKVWDEAPDCSCLEYYLASLLVRSVASQATRARQGAARLSRSESSSVRKLCTQRQLFTARANDCTMPSESSQELMAVKDSAGRWWRGLSAQHQFCLGGWQIFSLHGSSIEGFMPFSRS